ncbi:hypothetical protein [Glaesserella parasuis]|uniref:hypothetical protein n=1 Tax=Glaesserella parasuis TaxID=738 RepID=UPI00094FD779|nr:hypothetical protein [Glaesserella parasuis]MDG6230297.1 hypothetical protein [Glaesserella parasuis]MDG6359251.1 hypothetical protein [Glaesserella parasuis]MDG6364420.1 hypothetical protein [Glaesserella parasuis]MDO9766596.1 hypothetical protein [Glaesserella parasuis]MDP0122843.1 hypothetical protein [Glaesserella parasuis]
MEAVATLLNTLVSRILFGHFTMFLVFLFVSFAFIPAEWALYLNNKTPAFFPDWFSLANFGSFVFACVATMIWILFVRFLKWIWNTFDGYIYPRIKKYKSYKEWETVYQNLSKDELNVVTRLVSAGGAPLEIHNNAIRTSLISKKVIKLKLFNPMFQSFILTPTFYYFMLDKVQRENV